MDSTFFAFQHSPELAPMDLDADMVNPWASGNDLSHYIVPQTAPFPQVLRHDVPQMPQPDVYMPPTQPNEQIPPTQPDIQMTQHQPDAQLPQPQPDVLRSSQPQPANPPTTFIPGGFDVEDDTGSAERMPSQDSGRNRRALTTEIETSNNKARLVENDYSAMLRSQLRGARKGAQLAREDTIRNTSLVQQKLAELQLQQDQFIAHNETVQKIEAELSRELRLAKLMRENLAKEQSTWKADTEVFLARMKAEKVNEMAAYANKVDQDARRRAHEAQQGPAIPIIPGSGLSAGGARSTATKPKIATPPRHSHRHHNSIKTCRTKPPVLMGTFEGDDDDDNDDNDIVEILNPARNPNCSGRVPELSCDEEMIATVAEVVYHRVRDTIQDTQSKASGPGRRTQVKNEETVRGDDRLFLLRETRRLFKKKFGVTKDEDFAFYDPPDRDNVDDFDNELAEASAPDPEALKFDFDNPTTTLWNQKVMQHLVKEMEVCCHKTDTVVPSGYLKQLLSEKFARCHGFWNQSKTRVVNGQKETASETEARMNRTKENRLIAARHRERRVKKYDRRTYILKAIIDGEAHLSEEEHTRWKWLKKVIKRLGVDGMSSDESGQESDEDGIITTVYRVKKLRWRRRLDDELDFIDKARDYVKGVGGRGTVPGLRRRAVDNEESERGPVPNLPVTFYNQDWLNNRSSAYRDLTVRPSKEEFKWFQLAKSFGKKAQ